MELVFHVFLSTPLAWNTWMFIVHSLSMLESYYKTILILQKIKINARVFVCRIAVSMSSINPTDFILLL